MSKDHVAGLAIQIPEAMITQAIQAEIIKNIPNPQEWVAAIVSQALNEPGKDRFGNKHRSKTAFGQAVEKMIREEAESIFAAWLEEHREQIREALTRELTKSKGRRIKEVAEHIAAGMTKVHVSSVNLKLDDFDD